jgi:hypothetical protein
MCVRGYKMRQAEMAWNDWMVPELTDGMDLRLRCLELELRRDIHVRADDVVLLCLLLQKQAFMQQLIIDKATGRIVELEAMLALISVQPRRRRRWCQPRLWRKALPDLARKLKQLLRFIAASRYALAATADQLAGPD